LFGFNRVRKTSLLATGLKNLKKVQEEVDEGQKTNIQDGLDPVGTVNYYIFNNCRVPY
jgi:hypothetical protein